MELIQTVTVGSGGAAAIEFGAGGTLPTTYDDLYLVTSLRSTRSSGSYDLYKIQFNGTNELTSGRILEGNGSSVSSESRIEVGVQPISLDTANTFNSGSHYIPNHRSAVAKSLSGDSVAENNGTEGGQLITAGLWNNTAAITSLRLVSGVGNFVEGSSASLYGIRKFNTSAQPKATGGAISFDAVNNKWVHVFSTSGTFTPTANITCEYLVVAGGGAGGEPESGGSSGGGGGAGGYRSSVSGESSGGGASAESPLSLTSGTNYTVTIGAGGTIGGAFSTSGTNGSNSTFATITATGGGRGQTAIVNDVGNGGSGGGAGAGPSGNNNTGGTATTGQGYAGGNQAGITGLYAAGGGGAGAAGQNTQASRGGNGGNGVASSITGTSVARAGGGGGGTYSGSVATGGTGGGGNGAASNSYASTAGAPNTGAGGGAGARLTTGGRMAASNGGSGIVIVRYDA
jgi:hypothetical protein